MINCLKWISHVERMGVENLAKKADAQKVEEKGKGAEEHGWENALTEPRK